MIALVVGAGIYIRPFEQADAASFAAAAAESVMTVGAWMPWCHHGYSITEATVWINECARNLRANTAYDFGIFSVDSDRFLGGVSINQINTQHNFANVGYWVRQSAQKRGVASEAVRLIKDFGFDQLKFTRLEIVAIESNHASRAAAEKAGAVFEGIARNRLIMRDQPCTAAVYALIPGIAV